MGLVRSGHIQMGERDNLNLCRQREGLCTFWYTLVVKGLNSNFCQAAECSVLDQIRVPLMGHGNIRIHIP